MCVWWVSLTFWQLWFVPRESYAKKSILGVKLVLHAEKTGLEIQQISKISQYIFCPPQDNINLHKPFGIIDINEIKQWRFYFEVRDVTVNNTGEWSVLSNGQKGRQAPKI